MAKFPLTTGAYTARSVTAACQRCVNLYMEKNPDGEVFPFTFYPTPGLRQLYDGAELSGGWRGLYKANNGILYGVNGSDFVQINSDFTIVKRGVLSVSTSGPVSMVDNGNILLLVDGSSNGYAYTFANVSLYENADPTADDYASLNPFQKINQDAFYGADTVAFADGFFILNKPGSVEWYISTANTDTFEGADFASKAGNMDLLVAVAVAQRYVYLFGQDTTEVWTDVGATAFPYSRLPGVYIQYGCAAPASITQMDGNLFWLSRSPQGEAMILRSVEMQAVQISTFALANEITSYGVISDAVGWAYQINGHMFYMIWFPTADKTWQYDMSTGQWNEMVWIDAEGAEHAHRAGAMAFAYRQHVVGDRETGQLYALDENVYTDNGRSVVRRRGFVHAAADDFNRSTFNEVMFYMETGNGNDVTTGGQTNISLRWSDDGGKSWSNPVMRNMGLEGEYLKTVTFQRLGASRNRVFEAFWSSPVRTSLAGAFARIESHGR